MLEHGRPLEIAHSSSWWKTTKWAIGMAHERATSQPEIYRKAASFDMPGIEVDGMDVMAVRNRRPGGHWPAPGPEKAPL